MCAPCQVPVFAQSPYPVRNTQRHAHAMYGCPRSVMRADSFSGAACGARGTHWWQPPAAVGLHTGQNPERRYQEVACTVMRPALRSVLHGAKLCTALHCTRAPSAVCFVLLVLRCVQRCMLHCTYNCTATCPSDCTALSCLAAPCPVTAALLLAAVTASLPARIPPAASFLKTPRVLLVLKLASQCRSSHNNIR